MYGTIPILFAVIHWAVLVICCSAVLLNRHRHVWINRAVDDTVRVQVVTQQTKSAVTRALLRCIDRTVQTDKWPCIYQYDMTSTDAHALYRLMYVQLDISLISKFTHNHNCLLLELSWLPSVRSLSTFARVVMHVSVCNYTTPVTFCTQSSVSIPHPTPVPSSRMRCQPRPKTSFSILPTSR